MKSRVYLVILIFNFFNFFEGNCQEIKGRSKPQSLNISKIEDGKIPKLEITKLFFKDNDLNNRLDANEDAFIKFNLINSGDGKARNLKLIFLTSTSLLYLKKDIISKNDKAIKPNITALLNEILFFEV